MAPYQRRRSAAQTACFLASHCSPPGAYAYRWKVWRVWPKPGERYWLI